MAQVNEELDPNVVIARLKREVQQLKEELAYYRGGQEAVELTESEQRRCVILHQAICRCIRWR